MIRIGNINNLSAQPYALCTPPDGAEMAPLAPAALGHRTLEGNLDAALVPTALLPSVEAFMEPAGPYGIACTGPVGSVLLLARTDVDTLAARNGAVYITPESRTSRLLFQVLCESAYGHGLRMTDRAQDADAWLYIGDEAVARATKAGATLERRDLSGWWYEHTGLPFVFARWMVRRSLNRSSKALVQDWLEANAAAAERAQGRTTLARGAAHLFGSEATAHAYYQHLRQRLSSEDNAAQTLFLNQITEYRLWSRSA